MSDPVPIGLWILTVLGLGLGLGLRILDLGPGLDNFMETINFLSSGLWIIVSQQGVIIVTCKLPKHESQWPTKQNKM